MNRHTEPSPITEKHDTKTYLSCLSFGYEYSFEAQRSFLLSKIAVSGSPTERIKVGRLIGSELSYFVQYFVDIRNVAIVLDEGNLLDKTNSVTCSNTALLEVFVDSWLGTQELNVRRA